MIEKILTMSNTFYLADDSRPIGRPSDKASSWPPPIHPWVSRGGGGSRYLQTAYHQRGQITGHSFKCFRGSTDKGSPLVRANNTQVLYHPYDQVVSISHLVLPMVNGLRSKEIFELHRRNGY